LNRGYYLVSNSQAFALGSKTALKTPAPSEECVTWVHPSREELPAWRLTTSSPRLVMTNYDGSGFQRNIISSIAVLLLWQLTCWRDRARTASRRFLISPHPRHYVEEHDILLIPSCIRLKRHPENSNETDILKPPTCVCRRLEITAPPARTLSTSEATSFQDLGCNMVDSDMPSKGSIAQREGPKQILQSCMRSSSVLDTRRALFPECTDTFPAIDKREAAVVQCALNLQPCF
jgi:hypothetical protein